MANTTDSEAQGSQQPAALGSLLAALPFNVLTIVLHKSGPHTRQVCHAFHALHPPLLSLAPHCLPTPAALTAALATLPPSLTALDLRHVHEPYQTPLTATHITTICTRLPHLQRLLLPEDVSDHRLTPAALYAALAHLPHLHTLHAPSFGYDDEPPPPGSAPFHHPTIAARLCSLTLPGSYVDCLLTAPAAALPHLTALASSGCQHCHWPAAEFAALAAAAPALQSLTFGQLGMCDMELGDDEPLAALTTLTALTLPPPPTSVATLDDRPPAQLLQHIGTLTALRNLSFSLWHTGWTPAEAGWLSRLTQLTRLAICLWYAEGDHEPLAAMAEVPWAGHDQGLQLVPLPALVMASVARDAARLPLLRELELSYTDGGGYGLSSDMLAYGSPHSFLRHLAAATQLRRLCLHHLPLPACEACLLTSLQRLTCMRLMSPGPDIIGVNGLQVVTEPSETATIFTLQWVASLQGLRQLALHNIAAPEPTQQRPDNAVVPPCLLAVAAALTSLHTLSLPHLGPGFDLAAVLERLQGTLGCLDLRRLDSRYWPALGALGPMQQLQKLDLYGARGDMLDELVNHLRVPGSLRRCHLHAGGRWRMHGGQEALRQQHPLVDFQFNHRPDPLVQ